MKSYKDLEIYQISFELAIIIREMTLKLPYPDKYEIGGQIRRSSQGVKDTIVEGYGRKRYKLDFIKFLIYSHASLLEAHSQSEMLNIIYPKSGWEKIRNNLDNLGIKIHNFIKYVENNWKT